jgi:hypothetical protein
MMMENQNIAVGVVTSSNLKERYTACKQTWLKDFENTFLFGGNGNDSSLINFSEAGEDYNSHFLKQQLGLKYMYEHNNSYDWYFTLNFCKDSKVEFHIIDGANPEKKAIYFNKITLVINIHGSIIK